MKFYYFFVGCPLFIDSLRLQQVIQELESTLHEYKDFLTHSHGIKLNHVARTNYQPYFMQGQVPHYDGERSEIVFQNDSHSDHWALVKPMLNARRNHDSLVLNGTLLVNLLGRWARSVELTDLLTGDSVLHELKDSMIDPSGNKLNDLNHVNAALVDSLDGNGKQEIWLPCGFHGDVVNKEWSAEFVRIVEVGTWLIRTGPKMPRSGGACAALVVHLEGADEPAHICAFGGTDGSHDNGEFLDTVQCFDRRKNVWNEPFGKLPIGLDHANAIHVPSDSCKDKYPDRVLVMNFRSAPYASPHPEILAFDMPQRESLGARNVSGSGGWYILANPWQQGNLDMDLEIVPQFENKFKTESQIQDATSPDTESVQVAIRDRLRQNVFSKLYMQTVSVNHGRDASGVVTAHGARYLLNIGGVAYSYPDGHEGDVTYRHPYVFSNIRMYDVCKSESWVDVGDVSVPEFALQSCSSKELGVAITCGGASPAMYKHRNGEEENGQNSNVPYCFVNRFDHLDLDNKPPMHTSRKSNFND